MAWFIERNGEALVLPQWLRRILDDIVLWWTKECKRWAKLLRDRREKGFDGLTPKQKLEHSKFLENCNIQLILDKGRKTRIMQPQKCRPSFLLNHCVMMTVHLDQCATKLRLTSAQGYSYRLSLQISDGIVVDKDDALPDVGPSFYHYKMGLFATSTLRLQVVRKNVV